jgi:PAS domain S-box-containing protein
VENSETKMITTKSIPSFTILLPVISLVTITLFVLFMINSIKNDLIIKEHNESIQRDYTLLQSTLKHHVKATISQISIILESELSDYKASLQSKIHSILNHLQSSQKYITISKVKFLKEQIEIFNKHNPLYHINVLSNKQLINLLSTLEYKSYKKNRKIFRSHQLDYDSNNSHTYEYIIPYQNRHLHISINKELFIKVHKQNIQSTLLKINNEKKYQLYIYDYQTQTPYAINQSTKAYFNKHIIESATLLSSIQENPSSEKLLKVIDSDAASLIYTKTLPRLQWLVAMSMPFNKNTIESSIQNNYKQQYFKERTEELLVVIVIVSTIILLLSLIVAKIINTLFANFKTKIEEQNRTLKNFNTELSHKVASKTKELEASEERYRTIFERSRDGVLILEQEKITYCNDAMLKMFKTAKKSSVIDQTMEILFPIQQEDGHSSATMFKGYLDITMNLGHSRFEMLLIKSNKQTFFADIWLQSLELEGKKSIYVVFRDIDFQKKAQGKIKEQHQELLLLNETLEEKVKYEVIKNQEKEQLLVHQSRLAQMGEMISMIAHQWRQPLNAISTSTANMKLKIAINDCNVENFEHHLEQIDDYIQHLSETINDFRNFFKPDKQKQECSIDDLVNKSLNIIEKSLVGNDIEISVNLPNDIVLLTYPHELMQVILNILKNAEDILLERNIESRRLEISYENKEGYHHLYFTDNAGGIPQEILNKIFDPYFSTKNQKNGTGLGLYMSQVIISDHCKGKLTASNTDDGALFTISLPSLI